MHFYRRKPQTTRLHLFRSISIFVAGKRQKTTREPVKFYDFYCGMRSAYTCKMLDINPRQGVSSPPLCINFFLYFVFFISKVRVSAELRDQKKYICPAKNLIIIRVALVNLQDYSRAKGPASYLCGSIDYWLARTRKTGIFSSRTRASGQQKEKQLKLSPVEIQWIELRQYDRKRSFSKATGNKIN